MTATFTLMLIGGLILGFAILGMFIWGAKQGQFDDGDKMMGGLLFDSVDDLNDAISREEKIKEIKKNKKNPKNTDNKKADHPL